MLPKDGEQFRVTHNQTRSIQYVASTTTWSLTGGHLPKKDKDILPPSGIIYITQ